jgi:group I intron endonuclease
MKIIGIYIIQNLKNEKVYIGQSVDCEKRINGHIFRLKRNQHKNNYLQKSFNKHGIENFKFEILKECQKENLDDLERFFIRVYYSWKREFGYNNTFGGHFGEITNDSKKKQLKNSFHNGHHKHSEETKEYIRQLKKEYYKNFDNRLFKEKNHMFGQKWEDHPEWSRNSCVFGMKKENHPLWGKHHSEKSKQLMSEKAKIRKISDETRQKYTKSRLGRKWFNDGNNDYFIYPEEGQQKNLIVGRHKKGWNTHPKK